MKYDVKKLKNIDIRKLIITYNLGKPNDKLVFCPNHEKDGGDHSPSAAVDLKNNLLFCKSSGCSCCNKPMDNINIVSKMENLQCSGYEFIMICKRLENIDLKIKDEDVEDYETTINTKSKISKEPKEEDKYFKYKDNSLSLNQLIDKNDYSLHYYLLKRSIDINKIQDLLTKNNIEIKQQTITENGKVIDRICYIFDNNKQFACARKTGDYIMNKNYKDNKEVFKWNSLKPSYTYVKTDEKENKMLLIFEGFYDMLSFISTCHNVNDYDYISLNSTTHTRYLFNDYKDNKINLDKYNNIICLLDNDPAGVEATNIIKSCFYKYNIIDLSYLYKDYNDVNDYIINKGELIYHD